MLCERDAVGEALIAKMDATLQQLAASKPRGPFVSPPGARADRCRERYSIRCHLKAAGGVNVAASGEAGPFVSFGMEQLILAHPDVIAYASNTTDTPGLNADLAQHPLILKLYSGRRVTYPSALYSCGVVESANAAAALRADLLQAVRGGS